MENLIAEDLLLLLLDDEKGTVSSLISVPTVLGGALLVDLSLAGLVELDEEKSRWRAGKVQTAEGVEAPTDPVLERAAAIVAEKPREASALVDRLGKDVKDELADRLVDRGILERRDTKVLGLFPSKRWPSVDDAPEQSVLDRVRAVLLDAEQPDERTAALIALLSAATMADKVVAKGTEDKVDRKAVRSRAKELAEGDWRAQGVSDAIAAVIAAVTAASVTTTAATTVASS